MKRFLILFVIAFLTLAMTPNNTTNLYSIDQYDGYEQYVRGGHNNLVLDNNLLLAGGNVTAQESKAFVTFDLSQIDLAKAKNVSLHLYQITYNVNLQITANLLMVDDKDYQYWQNCQIYQFDGWQRTHQGTHEPKDCGFARELPSGTWYDTIRYTALPGEFRMQKSLTNSQQWQSGNLLPAIKANFVGKKFLTIGLGSFWPTRTNRAWEERLADGNPKNGVQRPSLVVTY